MIAALLIVGALAAQSNAWHEVHRTEALVVETRAVPGVAVNEMRATAVVDADADALWATVADLEGQKRLLPDTTVSQIVAREGETTIVRQRSEPRVLDPREYVIAVRTASDTLADGRTRRTLSWHTAPRFASLVDAGAVRVDVNQGFWAVERLADGRARITFQVLIDPGGNVPAVIVNLAQTRGAERTLAVLVAAAQGASAPAPHRAAIRRR